MKFYALSLLFLFIACQRPNLNPIEQITQSAHPAMLNVFHNPKGYEVQILYTEIGSDSLGQISFEDHSFRLNSDNYFYPASTVKLPIAVLALEYASANNIDTSAKYSIARDSLPHSIEDDVRQIFAVSDNEAYNRLYELLGRDYINTRLRELDLKPIRIAHRLSTSEAAKRQRDTLFFENGTLLGGTKDSIVEIISRNHLQKGKGYMKNEQRINQPMDFSEKNYFPLSTQHELMKRLFFPSRYAIEKQFQLTESSRNMLLKHMHTVPRLNGYSEAEHYDSYGKFFMYGDNKDRIPEHIKIYNKVGYAYGTLTETAFIVDEKEGLSFLVSATILVNKNGIFNDDTYEYDDIGIPFLAQLGRELYILNRIGGNQ